MTKQKALFLDRDGIINIDHGYVSKKEDFEFTEGIFELLHLFAEQEYLLFIITNQSGIGRGYYTIQDFDTLTAWMLEVLHKHHILIEKVAYCPHAPETYCNCRKPKTGMIDDIVKQYNIDLKKSWLIGDKQSDITLGYNCNMLRNIAISKHALNHASLQFSSVVDCYDYVCKNKRLL